VASNPDIASIGATKPRRESDDKRIKPPKIAKARKFLFYPNSTKEL
jgi:hypothetical protein